MTQRTTRAERMAQPRAADAIKTLAEASGGCIRPVQLRRTDLDTGQVEQVIVPCGATFATLCPACADRAKSLRAAQCREGWHLENEPIPPPAPPDDWQTWLLEQRAELQQLRDRVHAAGDQTGGLDELIGEVDAELARSGIRGKPDPGARTASHGTGRPGAARTPRPCPAARSARVPPARSTPPPDGRMFRPSMFLTLTCDSYGKVLEDGTPADPGSYDYRRAARDAIHFAALVDRFIQNLRRFLGYEVQYFAAVEPQKRLAPHVHLAIRGTVSRADLRQVLAATYHQVWWPSTDVIRFDADQLPAWHEASGNYLDPATGEILPTWDQALDQIGPHDAPLHVARFGAKFDAQGVLAGSKDSGRCIRYLTKYLTKNIADCHQPRHPCPAAACRPAHRRPALRALLTLVRELAALRHPAQEPPRRPPAGRLQGQGPPPRAPGLRRAPGPGLPQVVGQDPGRSPRRPQGLAAVHARPARPRRRSPLPVGSGHPGRP